MKRRIGTCFLALAMLLAMLPASALAAEGGTGAAADSWENCTSCSPDNPHHISTKEDLDRIRTHVATTETETTTTGYFILDSDIAFSESDFAEDGAFWNDGLGFEPIGVYQKPAADGETVTRSFVGSFDGNGHTISGLQIANDGTYGVFTGLFGHFKGTVKDLTFQDCAVSDTQGSGQAPVSGSACVGVLAGYVWGADARIENCTVADSAVTSDAQRTNPSSHGVGALAGRLCTGPTVTDCTVENVTVTGNRYAAAGGISGVMASGLVENCVLENVSITGRYVGSVVANLQGPACQFRDVAAMDMKLFPAADAEDVYIGGLTYSPYYDKTAVDNCLVQGTIDLAAVTEGQEVFAGCIWASESAYAKGEDLEEIKNSAFDVEILNIPEYDTVYVGSVAGALRYHTNGFASELEYPGTFFVAQDGIPVYGLNEIPEDKLDGQHDKGEKNAYISTVFTLDQTSLFRTGDDAPFEIPEGIKIIIEDPSVAEIDENGTLTVHNAGHTDVTVIKIINGAEYSLKYPIEVEPQEIAVTMTDSQQNYDGTGKTIEAAAAAGELPADLTLVYSYKTSADEDSPYTPVAPTAPGTYTVKVESGNPNYILTGATTATLTITAPAGKTDVSDSIAVTAPTSLTYDKTEKGYGASCAEIPDLTLTYYDAEGKTLSSAPVGAGTYTLVITGETEDHYAVKTVEFTIEKAAPVLALDSDSGTVLSNEDAVTFTYTYDGDGQVSVSSSDEDIATVSVNGNTVTVTGRKAGTAVVTVSAAEGENYTAASATYNLTVEQDSAPSGGSSVTRYEVAVAEAENGTVTVSPARAARGRTVTITATPDEGYEVASVTVVDADGSAVEVADKGDGKFTFTMPRSKVSVAVAFQPAEEEPEPQPEDLPFTDVAEGDWYYDAVAYAWENNLMTGTSATLFAPNVTTTRAMLATLLYRLEGEPQVNYLMAFEDVAEGLWYSEAVRWAASEGVVTGVGDGSAFDPNGNITREQMAVMLYRYADYKGYDITQGGMAAREYEDYETVSSWAQAAVDWAVNAGLISGTSATTLTPQGSATRAEIATILMRFVETFVPAE